MDNKLHTYFNHSLKKEEKEKLFQELSKDEQLLEEFKAIRNLNALVGLHEKNGDNKYASKQYVEFEKRIKRKSLKIQLYQVLKYVAVIFITLGSYGLYTHYSASLFKNKTLWATIEAPIGQRSRITLPDGTGVWLNAKSKLSYPADFSMDNRIVNLDGEAYFEVFSDEANPFHVKTEQMNVTVTGTKFNLKSYPDESAYITLMEGKVEVAASEDKESKIILKPNEQAFFSSSGRLVTRKIVGTNDIRAWTSGDFFYMDETLENLSRDLERRFNVQITIQDKSLAKEKFTYRANELISLEEILRHLEGTKELRIIWNNEHVNIVKP